ncbi:hypothetical protein AMS68_005755 [Peltaster fructicola]|uniref:RNA-directed DNA polymerase n=1 Tax=Peltaster fructicola TaxID=286661 RepID=A0A6H0Y070_9PEZI|nr:hypothetical protein AMS68_005755 [Peltaster fructicola]
MSLTSEQTLHLRQLAALLRVETATVPPTIRAPLTAFASLHERLDEFPDDWANDEQARARAIELGTRYLNQINSQHRELRSPSRQQNQNDDEPSPPRHQRRRRTTRDNLEALNNRRVRQPNLSPVRTIESDQGQAGTSSGGGSGHTESIPRDTPANPNMSEPPNPFSREQIDALSALIAQSVAAALRSNAARPNPAPNDPLDVERDQSMREPLVPSIDRRAPSWRDDEVGYFWPDHPDSEDTFTNNNGQVIMRDVHLFIDRVKDATACRGEPFMRERIPALLRGTAAQWYTTALPSLVKEGLRHASIDQWYTTLLEQFKRPLLESLGSLQRMRYTLTDARDRKPIATYVYTIVRHARDAGMDTPVQQLTYAYQGIDVMLRDSNLRNAVKTGHNSPIDSSELTPTTRQNEFAARTYPALQNRPALPASQNRLAITPAGEPAARPYVNERYDRPGYRPTLRPFTAKVNFVDAQPADEDEVMQEYDEQDYAEQGEEYEELGCESLEGVETNDAVHVDAHFLNTESTAVTPKDMHEPVRNPKIMAARSTKQMDPPINHPRYHYATVHLSLKHDAPLQPVCIDSGTSTTLVGTNFLEQQGTSLVHLVPAYLKWVRGVGGATSRVLGAMTLSLYFQNNLTSHCFAHVVENLRPNLLLGTDWLVTTSATLDFRSCQLALPQGDVSMFVDKPFGSRAQSDIPVRARTRTVLQPNKITAIPIVTGPDVQGLHLFTPTHQHLLHQILNTENNTIYAVNESNLTTEIPQGFPLGHLSTSFDGLTATEAYSWQDAKADNISPSWSYNTEPVVYQDTSNNPEGLPTRTGPFGATIYGDDDTALRISELVALFQDLFTDDGKIATIPEQEWMTVPLAGEWNTADAKLAHKVYPMGPKDRELLDATHDKLHRQGRMEWTKTPTPFGFPVFVVWRLVDGVRKGRVVVDVRGLNKITIPDSYPLPLQTDITSAVAGCSYLSTVDCTKFFHQLPVAKEDRHKFTVVTHRGQEQYNVALMGYKNAPPYAQRQIDRLLRESGIAFAKAFIDDIIVFSKSLQEHLGHLHYLFSVLQDYKITLSGDKSNLGFPSLNLLGQRVDAYGLRTTSDKLAAIKNLSFPSTLKDLETYIGMTGWLRHYVLHYATIVEPLQTYKTKRLKSAPQSKQARTHFTNAARIEATPELLDAFNALQDAFSDPKTLVHYARARPLHIFTDSAKQRGFGVIVAHLLGDPQPPKGLTADNKLPASTKIQPILYLSKTLSGAERRYWPTELEVAALVWAIKRVRWMIEGSEHVTTIYTDHEAIVGLSKQTSLNSSATDKLNNRLTRASQYMSQFNLNVIVVQGRLHLFADALSRLPARQTTPVDDHDDVLDDLVFAHLLTTENGTSTTILEIQPDFKKELQKAYDSDKHFSRIKARAESMDDSESLGFAWRDGLLWKDGRLCIPKALDGDIFEIAHDQQFHPGFHRLYARIRDQYYIRKLEKRLRLYIMHCDECKQLQTRRHKPFGDLHPILSPAIPFHTIAMDFIVGLPEYDEYNCLLTVTCKFSKRTILIPGHDQLDATAWAHKLLDELFSCDWGLPSAIISDRDPKFTSKLWSTMFDRLGIKLLRSTAYHPQTDGQSERTNQTVEIALRYYLAKNPDHALGWAYVLPQLRFMLNNSVSRGTGVSPNELCYGFRPREATDVSVALPDEHKVRHQEAEDSIAYAQAAMKIRYDTQHTPWSPQVGDRVYLKLDNYRIPGFKNDKLSQKYAGPFAIANAVGRHAYKLLLPSTWKMHPVVSVTELEPAATGDDPYERRRHDDRRQLKKSLKLRELEDNQLLPERLLDRRTRTLRGKQVEEFRVRHATTTAEHDKWVNRQNLPVQLLREYLRNHPHYNYFFITSALQQASSTTTTMDTEQNNDAASMQPANTEQHNEAPSMPKEVPRVTFFPEEFLDTLYGKKIYGPRTKAQQDTMDFLADPETAKIPLNLGNKDMKNKKDKKDNNDDGVDKAVTKNTLDTPKDDEDDYDGFVFNLDTDTLNKLTSNAEDKANKSKNKHNDLDDIPASTRALKNKRAAARQRRTLTSRLIERHQLILNNMAVLPRDATQDYRPENVDYQRAFKLQDQVLSAVQGNQRLVKSLQKNAPKWNEDNVGEYTVSIATFAGSIGLRTTQSSSAAADDVGPVLAPATIVPSAATQALDALLTGYTPSSATFAAPVLRRPPPPVMVDKMSSPIPEPEATSAPPPDYAVLAVTLAGVIIGVLLSLLFLFIIWMIPTKHEVALIDGTDD